MKVIDINVDLAEGFEFDAQLLEVVTSANICCGVHAGSPELSREILTLCRRRHVRVGAHPGYDDREGMGRRRQAVVSPADRDKLFQLILAQLDHLRGKAEYVKPHGALYHQSLAESNHASVLTAVLVKAGLPLMGFPGSIHVFTARSAGVELIKEGFIDRGHEEDGTLIDRSKPGAVLSDEKEILDQARRLAHDVDSLCVHGDTPGCLEMAKMVRAALEDDGFEVRA
jgi:UPF0271 protein